jgi:hypothetical protein
MAFSNDEIEKIKSLFDKFERAEILEEKAKFYNAAISEAKIVLENIEDSQCQKIITDLLTMYLRKFLRYILSSGKKAPIDMYILLIISNSEPAFQEKLKKENPSLAEKYDEFFTVAANNAWVMSRLFSPLQG